MKSHAIICQGGLKVFRDSFASGKAADAEQALCMVKSAKAIPHNFFSQMYFVYLKKKARNQGANFPGDAAGGLCGVALTKPGTNYAGKMQTLLSDNRITAGRDRPLPLRRQRGSFYSFSARSLRIWTALEAAPLRIWSPQHQRVRPFSSVRSSRILPTQTRS